MSSNRDFEEDVLLFHRSRQIQYRQRIGIQLTTACPVECAHCVWSCTTENAINFPPELLVKCISQWSEIDGREEVGITGGEPFFRFTLLKRAVAEAAKRGIRPYVATSAHWATSYEKALTCLRNLPGLYSLCISADRYHQKRVHPQNIINALTAAKQLEIEVRLLVVTSDLNFSEEIKGLTNHLYSEITPEMIQLSGLLEYGRMKSLDTRVYYGDALNACGLHTPLVLATGDIFVCCAASAAGDYIRPFYRGNLKHTSLSEALSEDSEDYWIIQCLRAGGPNLLAKLVGKDWQSTMGSGLLCEWCLSIFRDQKRYSAARKCMQDGDTQFEIATLLFQRRGESTPLLNYVMQE